jgi:DNA processing protein
MSGAAQPGGPLPPEAYAAVLAALPGIGPATLTSLIRRWGPKGAWEVVTEGGRGVDGSTGSPDAGGRGLRPEWSEMAQRTEVSDRWRSLVASGIGVSHLGGPGYPAHLIDDPQPPGVLFWRGRLDALDGLCIAIVGTRRCTHYGQDVARQLARDLAARGICVLSGLALGIDAAAHAGALESGRPAATVGVAASGVDVPYPHRHADLWGRVAGTGAVISESPPGAPAQAWRFPSRNRIIAGLAQGIIVVESAAAGGSMLTVKAAVDRGREVMAVPGPVSSPVSAGTNQLLSEGVGMVRHVADVLDCLGRFGPAPVPAGPVDPQALTARARSVLSAVDWTPTRTGEILRRCGMGLQQASTELHRLAHRGLVAGGAGWWERRRPPRPDQPPPAQPPPAQPPPVVPPL